MENQTINPKNFKEGDKLIIPTEATFLLQVQDDLFQVIINGISSYIRKDQIIEHIPLNPPPKEKTTYELVLEEIKELRKEIQALKEMQTKKPVEKGTEPSELGPENVGSSFNPDAVLDDYPNISEVLERGKLPLFSKTRKIGYPPESIEEEDSHPF